MLIIPLGIMGGEGALYPASRALPALLLMQIPLLSQFILLLALHHLPDALHGQGCFPPSG